jgi:hypothetical protein
MCARSVVAATSPAALPGSSPEAVADWLDQLAGAGGVDAARFRHAARVLRQRTGGRPQIAGDELAIDEAEHLLAEGRAGSLNKAYLMVAKAAYPLSRAKSVAERLRGKAIERRRKISSK